MRTPFLGAYDVGRSTNSVDAQLINLYLEIVDGKDGKAPAAFYATPGLTRFAACGNGPINGMYPFNGALHVISNNSAYIVSANGTVTANGTIGSSPITAPVSFIDSAGEGNSGPTQTVTLAVFTGAAGYSSTGGNFSAITLPAALTKPLTAAYQDGFGLVNQRGTNIWWQSNSLDLTTWSALNFTFADALPSNVVCIKMFKRQLWLLKTDSFEIWVDAGNSGVAFTRLDGPFSHYGCAAAFSVARAGDSLIWLSKTDQGQGQVMMASSYSPARISNHAIEHQIAGYGKIDDAIAYAYQQEGHLFYVITFPSVNVTWVYDVTASTMAGFPVWHQRAAFANGQFNRHQGNCYAFFNGLHLVGDWQSGNIYALDLAATTDNGTVRKWLRTWRALAEPTMQPRRFDSLTVDMQTGIGVTAGSAPLVGLRWSDDGGHTWSNQMTAAAGPPGKTTQRVKFTRLGSTRRSTGLDRIFALTSTDAFAVGLMGADITP